MSDLELSNYWEVLVEDGIATEAELQLVTDIVGYNEEALNGVLYSRTALHDLEQYQEEERKRKGE